MKELEYIYFRNREEFRNWLQKNHEKSPGIWLVFHKKHSKTDSITYYEALEEALCFGWIDSIIKRIDDDKYARKITPRKDTKKWSELNKMKVIELISKNKMTQSGLRKINDYSGTGKIDWTINNKTEKEAKKELYIPDFVLEEIARNDQALTNFNRLSQTCKRQYILWITSARKEATVRKRLDESIHLLKENKKLGLK